MAPGAEPAPAPLDEPSEPAPPGRDWFRPALVALAALAAVLYLWNLTVSGYANTYYSAAAQAAAQSWSAWFFGSLDAANFITVDKPPLALWVMGLSVRLFGLSSWSILLPQALAGVATVVLLAVVVRRSFGSLAGIVAGLVMALTPVAVLIFRYNNPDAVLTLLLVAAAAALLRGIETDRLRWTLAAAALVGLAFLTKYLQAYLVLPAFALTYLVAARGGIRRRIGGLLAAGVTVFVMSFWWVAIVELIPTSLRPYIGGSETDSALELILGYDGLGRLFGMAGPGAAGGGAAAPAGGGGAGFGGASGIFRMFNDEWGGQIGWLLPAALVALALGLWLRRRAGRTNPALAAVILWGGWLLTHIAVFSFMSGIAHPYYAVALGPAIGALVGLGFRDVRDLLARHARGSRDLRARRALGGLLAAATVLATAALAAVILNRTPEFAPGLAVGIVAAGAAVALVLAWPRQTAGPWRSALVGAMALAVMLAGPTAYGVETMTNSLAGGDPAAGPNASGAFGGGAGRDGAADGETAADGSNASAANIDRGLVDQDLIDYLLANRDGETWIVAIQSANQAGTIQLATGEPVMAMGGFSGSDPTPTLDELKTMIAAGNLRFVIVGGGIGGSGGTGGPGGIGPGGLPDGLPGDGGLPGDDGRPVPGGLPGDDGLDRDGAGLPGGSTDGVASTRDAWVTATCSAVDLGTTITTLYDCAGAS